jgi:hypothetical protein
MARDAAPSNRRAGVAAERPARAPDPDLGEVAWRAHALDVHVEARALLHGLGARQHAAERSPPAAERDDGVGDRSGGRGPIAWYENLYGLGSFGAQSVITTLADLAWSVHAADLDGDGDTDVLSASNDDGKVAWYENLDGQGTFGPQLVITTQADGARSVSAASLNGDGGLDVLSASAYDKKIAWYPSVGGGFGTQKVVSSDSLFPICVFAGDLDADGYRDVLFASSDDDQFSWCKNLMALAVTDVGHVPSFSSIPVVITGVSFGPTTTVLLDGAPTPIVSLTPTSITLQASPAPPKLRDLTVADSLSSVTLEDGLALWPTLATSTTGIGGVLKADLWNGDVGLYALALATGSLPSPIPITSPPTWYGVLLNPFGPLFTIGTGAFATSDPVVLAYPVPDNPGLAGLTVYLQAWCQQGFFGPEVTYSFTNMATVTL